MVCAMEQGKGGQTCSWRFMGGWREGFNHAGGTPLSPLLRRGERELPSAAMVVPSRCARTTAFGLKHMALGLAPRQAPGRFGPSPRDARPCYWASGGMKVAMVCALVPFQ